VTQAQQHEAVLWEARPCLEALCCRGKVAGQVALLAALQHSPRFQLGTATGGGPPQWRVRCTAITSTLVRACDFLVHLHTLICISSQQPATLCFHT
jgi:hypothetical protein